MNKFINEILEKDFTSEQKAEAFDSIARLYYDHNFGTASKSRIDLLMFKIYMEAAIRNHKDKSDSDSNTIDYASCSDYKIGMVLGITPQRVRNLKIQKEVVYPQTDFNWTASLKKILLNSNSIRYENKHIKINIPDPNLFLAIQDYIESQNGYVDIQLNSKLLQIREEYLLWLVYTIADGEGEKNTIESEINSALNKSDEDLVANNTDILTKIKNISEIGANVTEILANIACTLNPASKPLGIIAKNLSEILKRN